MQTELELKYLKLKDKVRKMIAAQKDYFRSNHDKQKLMIAKNLEKEVIEMVDPKPKAQKELFDLAQ